jgi:hypothetical protein
MNIHYLKLIDVDVVIIHYLNPSDVNVVIIHYLNLSDVDQTTNFLSRSSIQRWSSILAVVLH